MKLRKPDEAAGGWDRYLDKNITGKAGDQRITHISLSVSGQVYLEPS